MLDRIRRGPEPPVAATGTMSRRKQACPSRSVKASNDPTSSVPEEEPSAVSVVGNDSQSPPPIPSPELSNSDTAYTSNNRDDESLDIPPLVINTDAPSSPPPPTSIDVTPPLTEDTSPDPAATEDQPLPPPSPGLDIPPEPSGAPTTAQPLNLVPSLPPSPDHPSTPSSLNSGSSQVDGANVKQKRGKKIMPVQGNDGASHYQCPLCQERLSTNHEFTSHIRSHNSVQGKKPNSCTICGKELSSQSSLDRHMLVHSGERPFSCKVCGMSFTTNGNMHRHTRIHNKEDIKAAQRNSEGTKSSKSKSSSSVPLAPKPPSLSPPTSFVPSTITSSSWHRPGVYNPDRPSSLLTKPVSGVDLQKLMASESSILQHAAPLPVIPNHFLMQGVLSQIIGQKRPLAPAEEEVSPKKRARREGEEGAESRAQSEVRDLSRDKRESGSVNADRGSEEMGSVSAFSKVKFMEKPTPGKTKGRKPSLSRSGADQGPKTAVTNIKHGLSLVQDLSARTTTNAVQEEMMLVDEAKEEASRDPASPGWSTPFSCSDCEKTFDSQQGLEFHRLLTHFTNQQAEQFVEQALAANRNLHDGVDTLEENDPGFQDLDFMDFTARKFPLAAKALCEKVPRKSSSRFHNFTCEECCCSFPTQSALSLHMASHKPGNVTQCCVCQCHFINRQQLRAHMYTHAAKVAFEQSREEEPTEVAEMPESMEKEDFMALCGLVSKDELKSCDKNEAVIESISKEQNNKYYSKLYQVLGNMKAKEERISRTDSDADLLVESSSSVPSKRMPSSSLSPSTDNARASASAPPQLVSPTQPEDQQHASSVILSPESKEGSLTPNKSLHSGLALSLPSALQPMNFVATRVESGSSVLNAANGSTDKEAAKDVFQCSYCGQTFPTKRALKGHTRTHFGSPKYQCTVCNYSSSDKSTLTRHMRTHNGQRPFECGLCDFGFTTKANCERHIRKRHGFQEKQDVEKCLVFRPLSENRDNAQTPSTVCQYCGEDLKFLQALQIHLKIHHTHGELKAFQCTLCSARLSTKSRAVRHVQKHHAEVSLKDTETCIDTVPLVSPADYSDFRDLDDDSDEASGGFDTASPSPASTPGLLGLDRTPPMAHSTPTVPMGSRTAVHMRDTPLDFSLKSAGVAARLSSLVQHNSGAGGGMVMGEDSEEEPMDLSTKGRASPSPALSSVSQSPSPATSLLSTQGKLSLKGSSQELVIPCHLCNKTFSSQEAAQQHLVTVHQVSPSTVVTVLTPSDNNNNTSNSGSTQMAALLPMSVLSLNPSLTNLLQARSATTLPIMPTHPAFPANFQQKLANYLIQSSLNPLLTSNISAATAATTHKELTSAPSTTTTTTAAATISSGSESGCDLASVNKIIESTTSQNLKVFLKPQTITSGSDDSEPQTTPWESADEDSDQSLDKLYKESLNGPIVIKKEGEIMPAVRDVSSNEEEMDATDVKDFAVLLAETEEEDKGDSSQSPSPKTKSSSSPKAAKKTEPGSALVKKKRNSYADSPHKMKCPNCPRSFPWISSLNRHMLTHTGQKPFKCTRCNVTFSTKSNRERHLIRKHGVNMLDPASRQTMDRPYKCHLCVFSSFSTEGNLLKHYKERHPGTTIPERYLMRGQGDDECYDMDDLALSNMDGWSENGSMDTDDPESSIPTPTKAGVKSLVENLVTNLIKNESKPSPSSSKPPTPTDTNQNSIIEENEEDGYDNEPSSNNDAALPAPALNSSTEQHINPERDNYNVDKITSCWKCKEQFTSRKLLVRHLKEHNIDLPFKCYLCDASYDSRLECLTHQESSHPSDWATLKDKNGVESIEKYAEHFDRVVERNCKLGQFVEEGDDGDGGLQTTVSATTAGEDGQAEPITSDYLQRKVYCSLCAKRFWSLQDLRRHMRSHTGERPFECDMCQKRFTLKHSMMRHRRKHTSTAGGGAPEAFSDDEEEAQLSESSSKTPAANMGSGHKALRQHLATTASLKSSVAANIPTTVMENNNSLLALPSADGKNTNNEENDGEDILHNLLGVESETIDQIIDAKGSAASLLGV